jgi:hypothetical protein
MEEPEPNRDNFRGIVSGGATYARIGTSKADPIRVKTYDGPRNAAEFIASFQSLNGPSDPGAQIVVQGERGNVSLPMFDQGAVFTQHAIAAMRALLTPGQAALVEALWPDYASEAHSIVSATVPAPRKTKCDGEEGRLHKVGEEDPLLEADMCDACFEKDLGRVAVCKDYCGLHVDHVGLCEER